ncbi:MAG: hypothetical protein M0Z87_02345 [Actinomycetota bacterium]|nr:hypothetical protein [Actinomycetota bacterium]
MASAALAMTATAAPVAFAQPVTPAPSHGVLARSHAAKSPDRKAGGDRRPPLAVALVTKAQAGAAAEKAVTGASAVRNVRFHGSDGHDYFEVHLSLTPHGGATAWVDASTKVAVVVATQGDKQHFRDTKLVGAKAAAAAAVAKFPGAKVTGVRLHGEHWRYYEVKLRTTKGVKEQVRLSAVTGAVTQVHQGG